MDDRERRDPFNGQGRDLRVTRRQVLWGSIAAGAGLVVSRYGLVERLVTTAGGQGFVGPQPGVEPLVAELYRKEDLLNLTFHFYNLKLVDTPDGAALTRKKPNQPAFVVVNFPPQAIAERAFLENEGLVAPLPGGQWASAGESRLAFEVPPGMASIPYTTESLLSWTELTPNLVPAALAAGEVPPGAPEIRMPLTHETSIEIPWRLVLSPPIGLGWAHATGLVTHNGRTEIWHTRLGVLAGNEVDEWTPDGRTARAVWSPDYAPSNPPNPHALGPFRTSLTPRQRHNIVEATSDHEAVDGLPVPVQVNRMMLTPLGGWLDVVGSWDNHSDLLAWRHLATMGRDHYVRVVEKGYLFPHGHAAALITITERRFEDFSTDSVVPLPGNRGGFLRQRRFIVVRQPMKRYSAPGQPKDGRAWPFRSLRLTTLVTPVIDDPPKPEDKDLGGVPGTFVPKVGDEAFLFHVKGQDRERRDADFTTPVVFVPGGVAFDPSEMAKLIAHYSQLDTSDVLRTRDMSGQKVALAEPDKPGDTSVDLRTLVLAADGPVGKTPDQLEADDQPAFYPAVHEFTARLSAVEQTSASDLPPQAFTLKPYIDHPFGDANPGGAFAELVGEPPAVAFGADSSGGVVTPNFAPKVLSRELGAVGGELEDIRQGKFDPEKVFKKGVAKLLGGIDLLDILKPGVSFTGPGNASKAMQITSRPVLDPSGQPVEMVTELRWEPELKPDPLKLFEPDPGSLVIDAEFVQDLLVPANSTYDIKGDLEDFNLNLIGAGAAKFMVVSFDRLFFHARSGQKTDLKPVVGGVEFAGPLEFVNKIQDYLTFGGSGPYIDVDTKGLTAGYDLPLPQIPLGSLMINNIALGASLFIPWSGAPARIRFGLSSREKPFDVTYSAVGGGGFFGIAFGLDGLEKFECALELGGYFSLDLKVVSGSISLAGGIYFAIEKVKDEGSGDELTTVGLDAYIRFVGKVEVLGLVGLSLELYLALGLLKVEGKLPKLRGVAKAELKVKVLIFEGSVSVTVKRTISAEPNDPTFAHLFDEQHWEEYAESFV